MKHLIILIIAIMSTTVTAQSKKQQQVMVERTVQIPAEDVWQILAEDYGAISNSHPTIIKSESAPGTLKRGEGAERMC